MGYFVKMNLSPKGQQLVAMYEQMARSGYARNDGQFVENAFSDFELRPFREQVRGVLAEHGVKTLLDYGSGGSDWHAAGFDDVTGQSAAEYFGLDRAMKYEPARGIDERGAADCVLSFDVLEHILLPMCQRCCAICFAVPRNCW